MAGRLRMRAGTLIQQLDTGAGYRAQIERDLATRMEKVHQPGHCDKCQTTNDHDAKFCKNCGAKL
jgi:hypothetical protein